MDQFFEPYILGIVVLVIAVWGRWRYVSYKKLDKVHTEQIVNSGNEGNQNNNQSEKVFAYSSKTYNLIFAIQKRAFHSRTAAQFLFGFVMFLLFIGIISIIFGLPELEIYDARKGIELRELRENISEELTKFELGDKIDAMVEGRYWFNVSKHLFNMNVNKTSQYAEQSPPLKALKAQSLKDSDQGSINLLLYGDKIRLSQDCGHNWQEIDIGLKKGEFVDEPAFSTDRKIGIIYGTKLSIFFTTNGGLEWKEFDKFQKSDEWVLDSFFSTNRKTGIFIGSEESAFFTTDGGQKWKSIDLEFDPDERVIKSFFSTDGKTVIFVGRKKSVIFTTDGGQKWDSKIEQMDHDESVSHIVFSTDGKTGIIVGSKNSAFFTTDGGQEWKSPNLKMDTAESVSDSFFSTDGKTAIIVGKGGSVFFTTDGGQEWKSPNLKMDTAESVSDSFFSTDGKTAIIVGKGGSVFFTTDSGQEWEYEKLRMRIDEFVSNSFFSTDGKTAIIVGKRGSVFFMTDSGQKLESHYLAMGPAATVSNSFFSTDGKTVIIVGSNGSVFFTTNGGQDWKSEIVNMDYDKHERVVGSYFSADQTVGTIVGSSKSVNITWNGGENWGYTDTSEIETSILEKDFKICETKNISYPVLVNQFSGNVYRLKKHNDFVEWNGLPLSEIVEMFEKAHESVQNSIFFRNLRSKFNKYEQIDGDLNKNKFFPEYLENKDKSDKSIVSFDNLTINRIVTLTLLFFLARVLFQYAGYYLRLASFCDSRSDALLLAEDFAEDKSEKFDDLVYALDPNIHKFGPIPNNIVANLRSVTK